MANRKPLNARIVIIGKSTFLPPDAMRNGDMVNLRLAHEQARDMPGRNRLLYRGRWR